MKKFFYKIAILATLVVGVSSCKDKEVPVSVEAGVQNGQFWINISFGKYTGGGYYYSNGYPSYWSQSDEFSFVGYVWTNPVSNTGRPVLTEDGKPLVGPNGGIVTANIRPQMMKYLQYDPTKSELVPVVVTMKHDLSSYYYVIE